MASSDEMQVLLLTADPLLVNAFTDISRELGIQGQSTGDFDGFLQQFSSAKYEGLVLDVDTVPASVSAFGSVRESRPNKNTVIFAVATGAKHLDQALQGGAHFLLQRPIQNVEIRRTLHAAYDLMHGERRRYFRCAAELPVELTFLTSETNLQCWTMNVSSDGIAVRTPVPLKLAETPDIALLLPDGFTLRATGIVIWDDKHGKCGLKMQCSGPEMRKKLDSWLDSQFAAVHYCRDTCGLSQEMQRGS
jgi:DNA-binding response OmpR family regulator